MVYMYVFCFCDAFLSYGAFFRFLFPTRSFIVSFVIRDITRCLVYLVPVHCIKFV